MIPSEAIRSLQNPQIKRLVRLRNRRAREAENVILVEGAREIRRALQASVTAQQLFVCPELLSLEGQSWRDFPAGQVQVLSREAFEKVSLRENPDGLLAVAARPEVPLPEAASDQPVVVLHGLEKPGNVGAVVRSADAAGAQAVLVLGRGADPFSPNVIRASQGSVFALPVISLTEEAAFGWLRSQRFVTVVCTPDAPRTYWDAPLSGRVALLFGTEHQGLPAHWRSSETSVSIPMHPRSSADSLNVATAAALVLFECARQRQAGQATSPTWEVSA